MSAKQDKYNLLYDQFFLNKTFNSAQHIQAAKNEVDQIIKLLDLKSTATILDVACGSGRHLKAFHEHDFDCYGVDISKACIALAKINCPEIENKIFEDDIEKFALKKENTYDLVFSAGASLGYEINNVTDASIFKLVFDIVKKDGFLVLQFLNRNWAKIKFEKEVTYWTEDENYYILDKRKYSNYFLSSEKIFIDKKTKIEKKYVDTVFCCTPEIIYQNFDLLNAKYEKKLLLGSFTEKIFLDEISPFPVVVIRKC